jgi:aspartyl-tRNA(Asn)/glutamyl-tRNA(Gln) amidotransferase subunit B
MIARYLNISNADMEKGTMRLEANISLSKTDNLPNYKVELKNINSFKFLEKAIKAEIDRQSKALDNGEELIQETRGYDENTKTTFSQRTKADSHDYRYFPEADLPPVELSDETIEKIKGEISELPEDKRKRFIKEYGLSPEYTELFILDLDRANYFESAVKYAPDLTKTIANVMVNKNMDAEYPEPAGLIKKILEITKIDYASSKDVETAVATVISENGEVVESYKAGKGQVIGFLIGQVQKNLSGSGDPKMITAKLIEKLNV